MGIDVRETNMAEIEERLSKMSTSLNKIAYLESAVKGNFTYDIKRNLWARLAALYEESKMIDKAVKAILNKAGVDISKNDRIESFIKAAELYAKSGKLDEAEDIFKKISKDEGSVQRERVKLAMKNIYSLLAQEAEKKGKRTAAVKYYEKLIKMNLEDFEKAQIKEKLAEYYKSLAKFRELRALDQI